MLTGTDTGCMTSAGTRTFTIVTIVTLLCAPLMGRDGKRVGYAGIQESRTVTKVQCLPGDPCPARRTVRRRDYLTISEARKLAARSKPYRVRRGDTLASIARRFDVSVRQLRALNGIRDGDSVRARSILRIPRGAAR